LFQKFESNGPDPALARGETTRRLRLPFVGRDLILDFPDEVCWLAGEGGWLSPALAAREKTGSKSSVNFDAASAAPCRYVFLGLPQFVTAGGVAF
jgi:hypothetical protein